MNDLHEKKANDLDGSEKNGHDPQEAMRSYYKKFSAYLLLLYQAYLKKETLLDPEIKAAIWRMVKLQEDFPVKIRMLQLDLLGYETETIDGEWDAVKDRLFPIKDIAILDAIPAERATQIKEYKDVIFELLALKP